MKKKTINVIRPKSVVSRLRIGILAITAFVALTALASVWSTRKINEAHNKLFDVSIPTLAQSEELEANLTSLAELTGKITNARTSVELEAYESEFNALSDSLNETLAFSKGNMGASQRKYESRIDLAVLLVNTRDLILLSKNLISNRASISRIERQLYTLKSEMNDILELETLNAKSRLDQHLSDISQFPEDLDILSGIGSDIKLLSTLNEFALSSDLLISEIVSNSGVEGKFKGAEQLVVAQAEITDMSSKLHSFPTSEVRDELDRLLNNFQTLTFGEAGMQKLIASAQSSSSEVLEKAASQETLADRISKRSIRSVREARIQIEDAFQATQASTQDATKTALLTTLATLLIAGTILYFVVERQINRRMNVLTRAVLEIAKGNTSQSVRVTGEDELGQMAHALEVFKTNANDLRRSNEDLERFAYVASHDMKSPLRAIKDLATWTIEDAGDTLPQNCRENLSLMIARVNRLSNILDNLLEYSRVGIRQGASAREVDVNIISLAVDAFKLIDKSKNFTLKLDAVPTKISTLEVPLRQVLQNLFTNAIKHHDMPEGCITLHVTEQENSFRFGVEDDGPGIDVKYQQRIFEMFQTLKPRDEVEGSGMGLAIIRKLVEHQGGAVWLRSNPKFKRGSTFYFDWPKHIQNRISDKAA